jgi:transcriptional regulator with XRE-family HTH domain
MSRVAVKRELLRWARERSGLEAADLVERFPKYEAWESGDEQPTFRQLEKIARKTLTPFGYFFLSEPPEEKLPIPDFRTLRDRPVKRPTPNLRCSEPGPRGLVASVPPRAGSLSLGRWEALFALALETGIGSPVLNRLGFSLRKSYPEGFEGF